MRKPKSNLELMQESRNVWNMSPVTRVQGNKKKDKKRRRQEDRKSCLWRKDKQDFFIFFSR